MANSSSIQDVCLICVSPMHASFEHPSVGPSNIMTVQVNAIQGFSPTNDPHSNTIITVVRIILTFLGGLQMWRTRYPN